MDKIDVAPLPVAAKLQAINTMAISKLNFYFPNMLFTEKTLDRLEDVIVSSFRSWFELNNSSNRAFMFTPRKEGGLGLIRPRTMYYAKKLSFYLSVLNSDDEQTKHTARHSLTLHMTKRKCELADPNTESNYAGYKLNEDNKLIKGSRVDWRKSQWIHLHELCKKLNVQLHFRGNEYVMRVKTDDDIEMTFSDSRSFFTFFKQQLIESTIATWKALPSQGRIANVEHVNRSLSYSHLTNLHLSDKLVTFVVKAKLQLLACNSLLHVYYPDRVERHCSRCGFYTETVSHILNGCRSSKSLYQKRHNRIANILIRNISDANPGSDILSDKIVKPCHFDTSFDESETFVGLQAVRPDAMIIDKVNRTCFIAEVAVPFDTFLGECYNSKFNKYLPLCQSIHDLGYECKILVFIVGSLGSVHPRFISGLKLAGIPPRRGRGISKYCSISAAVGSRMAWKRRCADT